MLGRVRLCAIPSVNCSIPGFPVLHYLPEFAQTHAHWVSDAIQPSHPLSPPYAALNFSQDQGFFNESALCSSLWPKFWSFSFSISPSDEYSGLISFSIDWFDLLTVQGTLNSLLQHHSSKALALQGSIFFMVQLSHPYMTIGKTIALNRRIFKTCNIPWSPRIQRSNTWMPIMARCLDLEHCIESSPHLYKLVLWGFYFSLYIVKSKATGPKWNHLC